MHENNTSSPWQLNRYNVLPVVAKIRSRCFLEYIICACKVQSTEVNVFAWARSWLVRYLWNLCQDSLLVEAVKCISPSLDNRPKMRVQLLCCTHPKDGFKNSKDYRSDENHKVTHHTFIHIYVLMMKAL